MDEKKNKDIAVLGLGTFGYELAIDLYEYGYHVLAVDRNIEKINQIIEKKFLIGF